MRINKKEHAKRFVLIAVIMFTVISLTGCAKERLKNELKYRQIGLTCMESGDYQGAVDAFDYALSFCLGAIGETEIDICYYKAAAQYAAGDLEGALATYDALIGYNKKDASAYYTRGCLHLQRGEGEAAFADFKNAVAYDAENYELYIHIYENLAAYHLMEEGKEYLNKAFQIKGSAAENLTYRGKLYLLLGEYENATAELKVALEKGSIEANLVMAQVFEAKGDAASAETYYKAYEEKGAGDSKTMNALAEIQMAKSDYAAALNYINQGLAMEQVTNKHELMQNQIICLEYMADFAGAWKVAQEYVQLYPNDMEVQREYIFLKSRQNGGAGEQQIQADVTQSTEDGTTEDGSIDDDATKESAEQ